MSEQAWLIVGLGNPGPEYEKTRHNIGAMVAGTWAKRLGWKLSKHKKAQALTAEGRFGEHKVVIALPSTYMNNSGSAVASLQQFYKIDAAHTVALHDELDIPFETIRIKIGGGDNGHNGLKSTTNAMTAEYFRIRMGIGRPIGQQDPADFVLKNFASAEKSEIPAFISRGADAIEYLIKNGLQAAQGAYNQ